MNVTRRPYGAGESAENRRGDGHGDSEPGLLERERSTADHDPVDGDERVYASRAPKVVGVENELRVDDKPSPTTATIARRKERDRQRKDYERTRRNFGKVLRAARRRYDLSQNDLSEASGINFSHISSMERGKRTPQLETLHRLADGMGTTVARLIYDLEVLEGRLPSGEAAVGEALDKRVDRQ